MSGRRRGRLVSRETYIQEYHELTHKDGLAFFPYGIWKDFVFSAGLLLTVAVFAAIFGPYGPWRAARSDHH